MLVSASAAVMPGAALRSKLPSNLYLMPTIQCVQHSKAHCVCHCMARSALVQPASHIHSCPATTPHLLVSLRPQTTPGRRTCSCAWTSASSRPAACWPPVWPPSRAPLFTLTTTASSRRRYPGAIAAVFLYRIYAIVNTSG